MTTSSTKASHVTLNPDIRNLSSVVVLASSVRSTVWVLYESDDRSTFVQLSELLARVHISKIPVAPDLYLKVSVAESAPSMSRVLPISIGESTDRKVAKVRQGLVSQPEFVILITPEE